MSLLKYFSITVASVAITFGVGYLFTPQIEEPMDDNSSVEKVARRFSLKQRSPRTLDQSPHFKNCNDGKPNEDSVITGLPKFSLDDYFVEGNNEQERRVRVDEGFLRRLVGCRQQALYLETRELGWTPRNSFLIASAKNRQIVGMDLLKYDIQAIRDFSSAFPNAMNSKLDSTDGSFTFKKIVGYGGLPHITRLKLHSDYNDRTFQELASMLDSVNLVSEEKYIVDSLNSAVKMLIEHSSLYLKAERILGSRDSDHVTQSLLMYSSGLDSTLDRERAEDRLDRLGSLMSQSFKDLDRKCVIERSLKDDYLSSKHEALKGIDKISQPASVYAGVIRNSCKSTGN